MFTIDEACSDLKKYFKKLSYIVDHEAQFVWGRNKIINKNKIDDILCCIESAIPQEYKDYIKKRGSRRLKSDLYYKQLKAAIQNKFFWSTSLYKVRALEVNTLIPSLIVAFNSDLNQIFKSEL